MPGFLRCNIVCVFFFFGGVVCLFGIANARHALFHFLLSLSLSLSLAHILRPCCAVFVRIAFGAFGCCALSHTHTGDGGGVPLCCCLLLLVEWLIGVSWLGAVLCDCVCVFV